MEPNSRVLDRAAAGVPMEPAEESSDSALTAGHRNRAGKFPSYWKLGICLRLEP